MSQALYRTWRPQVWDAVVGQPQVIQTLKNAVAGDRVAHAYLFSGPRGTGKTTVARLLAKAVNCLDPDPVNRPCNKCDPCVAVNENRFLDLIEIDAASQTGVEDVRDLRDKINFTPNQGKYKIYIIDEVHMFSNSAFNALLKTLEEPPPHAIFILATTEIHKIPPTVLSRCQRHEFRRLPVDVIIAQLQTIIQTEKIKADPGALALIARNSAGGMRDAISLLDQLASAGKVVDVELAQAILGTATSQTVLAVVTSILEGDPGAGMSAIHLALDSGTDARLLARQLVDYLRNLLMIKMGNDKQVNLPDDVHQQAREHARMLAPAVILRAIKAFNAAATEQRGSWQPALHLELALAELHETPAGPEIPVPDGQDRKTPAILFQMEAAASDSEKNAAKPPNTSPAGAGETGLTLNQIAKAWKQVSTAVREYPDLNALLNSCKVLDLKSGTLMLGFTSEILRARAETPEYIGLIHKAILDVVGADLVIKCVETSAKQKIPTDVKANGMVAAALNAGGEIVDIQE